MSISLQISDFQGLTIGSHGRAVQKIQHWLQQALNKPSPQFANPGVFDQETAQAVRRFKLENQLRLSPKSYIDFRTLRMLGLKVGFQDILSDGELPPGLAKLMTITVIQRPGLLKFDPFDRTAFFFLYDAKFEKFVAYRKAQYHVDPASRRAAIDAVLGFMIQDRELTDLRWFAYMLATTQWESDFVPREETGKGAGKAYGVPIACPKCPAGQKSHVYFGRGFVQLTFQGNYRKLGERLGMGDTLVHEPERALDPATAYKIMSVGMREGLFTGHKLSDYISGTRSDYFHARNIVNPGDSTSYAPVATWAEDFEEILEGARL
jgi:hypothetical protein